MRITRTINYGWHTIRERYHATCRSCSKQYPRTTSTGYNDMASPEYRAEARVKLKAEAEQLSKQPITCHACRKTAIAKADPVDLIAPALLDKIAAIEAEQDTLRERKRAIEREFNQHRGRLFLHAGEVYAQWGCSFGYDGDRFSLHGYRVSKTRPWETTDVQVYAPIAAITYLDDTLESRKAKAGSA